MKLTKKLLIVVALLVVGFTVVACGEETTVTTTEAVTTTTTVTTDNGAAPEFSGVDAVEVPLYSSFDPVAGVTATDAEDGNITTSIFVNAYFDNTVIGVYTVTYQVTDEDGNVTTVERPVSFVALDEEDYPMAQYLSGVDLSKLPAEDKDVLFAAAERYLLEHVYAGVPLYTGASRVMYSDRVQLFSPEYNGVMGFGTAFSQFSADDSTVKMTGDTLGTAGEYTWRASYSTDPTSLNPWIVDDSSTSDFIALFTGGLYDMFFDASKTGYEINPSLAVSDPIPVNPTTINGKQYAKIWQIPLRDDLTWTFHPDTDTTGFATGFEKLDASDYLWTWKTALDEGWFRARTGGGDFVSQGIVGAADYLDGNATWEEVGLRLAEGETNVIELEYITEKSMFDIKYGFTGATLCPINEELYNAAGGATGYGMDPLTVASSGVYYFDQWTTGQLLTFKKNDAHPDSAMYHYTGYQYRYINGSWQYSRTYYLQSIIKYKHSNISSDISIIFYI